MNRNEYAPSPASCHRPYSEQDWIDWLLGHGTPQERAAMQAHLGVCALCAATVAEWKPLLSAEEQTEHGYAEMPSKSMERRLRRSVIARGIGRRASDGLRRHKKQWTAAAAVLVAALCLAGLYRQLNESSGVNQGEYVAIHEPGAVSLVNDPNTESYTVRPDNAELGRGYVWFNDSSGEMLVLLDGLFPSSGYEIQAWAVQGNDHVNLGLLRQLELSRAHLYVKMLELTEFDNVALTIEPSGGSAAPTSPDAVLFRLEHGGRSGKPE